MATLATARAGARATNCANASAVENSTNSEDTESILGLSNDERSVIGRETWSSAAVARVAGKNKAPPNACALSSGPTVVEKSGPHAKSGPTKRRRKERQSNWTQLEVSALIQAKREKFFDDLENQHEPNLMRRENTQWSQISVRVMEICGELVECNRDSSACKDKWGTLLVDYKKIFDCHKASGTNSYWTMSSQERTEHHLPRNFQKENYDNIDEWYRIKPIMNPVHTRDLSHPGDGIYKHAEATASLEHSDEAFFRAQQPQQPHAGGSFVEKSTRPGTNFDKNIPSRTGLPSGESRQPPTIHGRSTPALNAAPKTLRRGSHLAANGTAPGTSVGPINLLSSSEASLQEMTRKFGNTGQRRKSLSGHSKIAEATNSSGEKLVTMLEKLNEKDSKLQWDMFHEQLRYNRERDLVTQENARLTHANQGNLVQAIASLTQVLSASLQPQMPYGPPQLPYRGSTSYGLAANYEAPPTYSATTAYGAAPTYGATPMYQPLWTRIGQHTKLDTIDATLVSVNEDASNDEVAAPENLLSTNE